MNITELTVAQVSIKILSGADLDNIEPLDIDSVCTVSYIVRKYPSIVKATLGNIKRYTYVRLVEG